MEHLSSPANQMVKWAAGLVKDRKNRTAEGLFVAEGEKLIRQAISAGCHPHALFFVGAQAPGCVDLFDQVYPVTKPILEKICAVTTAPDQVGVFALPDAPKLPANAKRLVALDCLQDPSNVGAIMRTALALGYDGVLASADTAELFSPKILRASMGATLCLPVVQQTDFLGALRQAKTDGYCLYATMLRPDAQPIDQVTFAPKSLLVIGNEGHGISEEAAALCDVAVLIPMAPIQGEMQSLNAAAAAAIALWETNRPYLCGHPQKTTQDK